MNKRLQISTKQLAAQVEAIESNNASRPLHPDRLKVEDRLWKEKYAALFAGVRRGTIRRKELQAQMNAEANQILFGE